MHVVYRPIDPNPGGAGDGQTQQLHDGRDVRQWMKPGRCDDREVITLGTTEVRADRVLAVSVGEEPTERPGVGECFRGVGPVDIPDEPTACGRTAVTPRRADPPNVFAVLIGGMLVDRRVGFTIRVDVIEFVVGPEQRFRGDDVAGALGEPSTNAPARSAGGSQFRPNGNPWLRSSA